jgi:hypothetical protein
MVLLAICLVCPLVEMFDHWDHTIQTGNDSEYALVVLALCVGAATSFARFILKSPLASCIAKAVFPSSVHISFPFTPRSFSSLLLTATSPPAFALRI